MNRASLSPVISPFACRSYCGLEDYAKCQDRSNHAA